MSTGQLRYIIFICITYSEKVGRPKKIVDQAMSNQQMWFDKMAISELDFVLLLSNSLLCGILNLWL